MSQYFSGYYWRAQRPDSSPMRFTDVLLRSDYRLFVSHSLDCSVLVGLDGIVS